MVNFNNPVGLYALLALIPLVILYLIRPRPKEMMIPSLMFFMQEKGLSRQSSFLKRLLRDVLFLLHLLALIGLAFAVANPSSILPYDATSKNTIIVLDTSASMHTQEGSTTRFAKALSAAKDNMKGSTSIILAENSPLLILENKNTIAAKSFLSGLDPKGTSTNLGDAMLLAQDILQKGEGRVIVLSDFLWNEGPDPEVIKKMLESSNVVVDFVNVAGEERKNVGIVDVQVDKFKTKVYLKNFNNAQTTVHVEVRNGGKPIDTSPIDIMPNSVETFSFDTIGGITAIEIKEKDDLLLDNRAYISAPNITDINVLLVTNELNEFLKNALLSSGNVKVDIVNPPLSTERILSFPHKIIVLSNWTKGWITPQDFKTFRQKAESDGTAIVITAQQDLNEQDTANLLPVGLNKMQGSTSISSAVVNQLTKDVDFGTVTEHFSASAPNDTIVLASADDGSPMVALRNTNGAKIFYYGIMDDKSDFKFSPSYPIFWSKVIDYVIGAEDINNFNHRTGSVLTFNAEKRVKTPSGSVKGTSILLDEPGLYEVDGVYHAANLYNEKESDINARAQLKTKAIATYTPEKITKQKEVSFEGYLVFAVIVLLALELMYVKMRGDL